jgi:8-oxo-dGTP pyrophosphatase MutT (NUDIX family)
MLLRDGKGGLEVFMLVRHDAMSFAAGALVFPGGSVDACDRAMAGDCDRAMAGDCDRAMAGDTNETARIAAVRETFEECGILLARPHGHEALISADALKRLEATWRARLASGQATLAEMISAENLVLATDRLVPFAHWITPEVQPKRFDTLFFLAAAPNDQVGLHDGKESIDSIWIKPADAVSQADAGRYKLVFATQLNLVKLARHDTVAAALAAARTSQVVTVLPVQEDLGLEGARRMRIPTEAGYGGDVFVVTMPPASRV